jgi:HEPN domain-containing protein
MPSERFPPDDPREWLNRAKSNLTKARNAPETPEIYLEDLCFDAQQAAEKAIKAVLIHLGVRFPYIHDLAQLLSLVEQAGQSVSESIRRAASLSDYAVETRYPGLAEPVTLQEYEEAVAIAEEVVEWAQSVIGRHVEVNDD